MLQDHVSTESGEVLDPKCIYRYELTFLARPYRWPNLQLNKMCFSNFLMIYIIVMIGVSIFANLACICYLCFSNIKLKRKYQQLLYLNVTSCSVAVCLLIHSLYRLLFYNFNRFWCLFGFSVLTLATSIFGTSLVSISIDCLIAVVRPMQYRLIVTTRRVVILNVIVLGWFLFFNAIYPLSAFSWKNGGHLYYCLMENVMPSWYQMAIGLTSAVLMLMIMILNMSVLGAAANALWGRQRLMGANAQVQRQVLKLAMRMIMIVTCNIGLSMPLNSQTLKLVYLGDDVLFSLFMSIGPANILLFVVADAELRQRVATDMFQCGRPKFRISRIYTTSRSLSV